MCGRYVVFTEEENQDLREIINGINERFKSDAATSGNVSELSHIKTSEIFPTDMAPVITTNLDNKKVANVFKWGFPNYKQSSGVIINARCETLHEKPTFRKLLTPGRCLVPASGFYEWNKVSGKSDKKKEKYLIRASNSGLIYFAGLYNSFVDKNGISSTRFVIITTDANEQMSQIHNRMPVILSSAEAATWINQSNLEKVSNSGLDSGITFNSSVAFNSGIFDFLRPYRGELVLEKVV